MSKVMSPSVPSGTAGPHTAPSCAHLDVDVAFCSLSSQNCFGVQFSNPIPLVSFIIGMLIFTLASGTVIKFTESELFYVTDVMLGTNPHELIQIFPTLLMVF